MAEEDILAFGAANSITPNDLTCTVDVELIDKYYDDVLRGKDVG